MNIELKRHVSQVHTKAGVAERDEGQFKILIDGKLCGYVTDKPGSLIRLIVSGLTDEEVNEIKSKVDELRGCQSEGVHQIPNIQESTYVVELETTDTTEIGF